MNACVACSHRLRSTARYCDECGARVGTTTAKRQQTQHSLSTPPRTTPHRISLSSHSFATTQRQVIRTTPPHSLIVPCLLFPLSASPSSDTSGLDELKELVQRELTSNGILNKLRAQLRAHIYTTLTTHTATTTPTPSHPPHHHPLPTPLPATYHSSLEGTVILALVSEYCQFHALYNTLSVLQLETGTATGAGPGAGGGSSAVVDRVGIARSLHVSASSAAVSSHSLAYELYLMAQTSRPSSPLVSPRSETRPIPLSHHSSSPSKGTEDLTPPVLSPHRTLSLRHIDRDGREEDDLRRLHEVETQLAAMRANKAAASSTAAGGGGGDVSEEYSEDWTGVSLDGTTGSSGGGGGGVDVDDVYGSDEVVLDGESWAKRYDYVEAAQRAQ